MGIQQMVLGTGGGIKPFYTDSWSGVPTWSTTSAAYASGNMSLGAYGSGIDTYGDYIIYAPRNQSDINIYEISTGNLATSINCGLTNWNSYGIGMDSVRGHIFTTEYSTANVMKLDISGSCTNNPDGEKLTFSSTSISATITTATSNVTPWAVIQNDDRCDLHQHIYFPHDPTHYMHDTWIIGGRGLNREVLVFNAYGSLNKNYKKVISWPSSANTGSPGTTTDRPFGGSYDWSSNSLLVNKRDHTEIVMCHDNTTDQALNTSNMYSHAHMFGITSQNNFQALEDAHIDRFGRLIVSQTNSQLWFVFDRFS